jgi:hypothetical protein
MTQVDTSIYGNMLRPVKSVQEYDQDAQQAEGNKLGLLLQRGQYDAQQRGVAEDNAFRNALSSGADDRALMAASPTRALAFQEGRAKIAKEQALTTKATSEAKKTDWESAVAKQAHIAQLASSATDQASWTQARKIAEMLGADVSQVPEQFDPATAKQFGTMAMTQAQRLDQAHKDATLAETERNNKERGRIAARQASTAEGQLGVSRERLSFDKTKPQAANSRSGPMSVTLQKELIESDDNVQQSASAIAALKKAKTINDKAYSGYGASTRAALVSNLGGSKSADATVELDNLIGNQALSSLKTIFGGNPTEGERAILLDLQASSSKTPTQRTAIIDRAIKAAEVRSKYAGSKAQSIRSGKYLTEGAPAMGADDDINSQADAILRGGK